MSTDGTKADNKILIGCNDLGQQIFLYPEMANRHGLIAGATGTGKTVTLQILAEAFSDLGVPVFTADVKGDLSGLAANGVLSNKLQERIEKIQLANFSTKAFPTVFWDLYSQKGHPVRTTISEMGPILLSRLLNLNDTQEGILHIAFKYADDEGLLILDLKDLQELLKYLADHASELRSEYGNIHPNSVAAIQRDLLVLEEGGADQFFAEPAIKLQHLMQKDFSGKGVIGILDATKLMHDRRLYSTFLLWFLSELFETLPEVGDQSKPNLVFFFDEAHLLFKEAPKALIEKIETVVRLIRSKGVSIFFVTQNPADIPDSVLSQLGNRFLHALRAFTPAEQKAIRVAADTFRQNERLDTEQVITELGVGEALVSVLGQDGTPTPVERTLVCPPGSRIGPLTETERTAIIERSPLKGQYDEINDRESAYEILQKKIAEAAPKEEKSKSKKDGVILSFFKSMIRSLGTTIGRLVVGGAMAVVLGKKAGKKSSTGSSIIKSVGSSMQRSISGKIGRSIARGILGSVSK